MQFDRIRCLLPALLAAMTAGLVGSNGVAHAATVLWDGGAGTDQNWTTGGAGGNWSGDAVPGATDDAVFTDVAGGGSAGTVTNVVDGSITVQSLSYQFGTTPANFFHTTQI